MLGLIRSLVCLLASSTVSREAMVGRRGSWWGDFSMFQTRSSFQGRRQRETTPTQLPTVEGSDMLCCYHGYTPTPRRPALRAVEGEDCRCFKGVTKKINTEALSTEPWGFLVIWVNRYLHGDKWWRPGSHCSPFSSVYLWFCFSLQSRHSSLLNVSGVLGWL